jgi:WS/DGAT/MGAT family acyltransferase
MPKQLSGLDATFLYLESPEMPMHVGSLCLYELPAGFKGDFAARLRAHIKKRMHLAPLFSNRLHFPPFDIGHPVWLHDPKVDLQYHIRRVTLRKPGTLRQLEDACAREHERLLDRSRPLWEFVVFDGLKSGQVGFYSKIHHAALDGKGGTVLANAVLDMTPEPREVPPPDARKPRRTDLKVGEMVSAVFSNTLAQYAKIVRSLPTTASTLGQTLATAGVSGIQRARAKGGVKGAVKAPFSFAPRTSFNNNITATRKFARASLRFDELRSAGKALGGSLNDAVLFVCSTALRAYLQRHSALPRKSLIAAMPVSLREEGNTEMNNQASMTLVELGSQHADASKRFAAILKSTAKVKDALGKLKNVLPTDYPSLMAPWVMSGLGRAISSTRVAERAPALANVVISNVPGPPVPLFMAGARMVTFHPLSICIHGVALNITVQSYAGSVDFGLIACKKAAPDLHDLARDIEDAHAQLLQLAERAAVVAKPRAAVKKSSKPARKAAKESTLEPK